MRVQRDIPTNATEAGVDMTNLRQYIHEIMAREDVKCRCIRCREIGRGKKKGKIKIKWIYYDASDGDEFFISAEDKENIYGFCRLRFPSCFLRKEITPESALIRELHIYGEAAAVGEKGSVQHKGLGKALLQTAEDIARTYYKNKIVVISGVGVRGYYKKLGYKKEGPYMVKKL
jgi:elongator complex protein 3